MQPSKDEEASAMSPYHHSQPVSLAHASMQPVRAALSSSNVHVSISNTVLQGHGYHTPINECELCMPPQQLNSGYGDRQTCKHALINIAFTCIGSYTVYEKSEHREICAGVVVSERHASRPLFACFAEHIL